MKPLSTKRAGTIHKLAGWLTLFLMMAFFQSAAFAHAHLVKSQPAANAALKQAPKTVELWFSEELAPSFNAITVTDQQGRRVDKDDLSLSEGDKKLQIDLQDVGSGTYTVDWKNLSADQHTMKGRFTFTVALAVSAATPVPSSGAQTAGQPPQTSPQATPPQTPPAAASQESGTPWTMSVVRWLEYLAMMALFGGFTFRLLILGPALRGAHGMEVDERATGLSASERRFLKLSGWALALLAVVTLAALILQTAIVMDTSVGGALSPSRLYQVITRTSYGGPWLLQAATVVVLAVILFLLARQSSDTDYERHAASAANTGLLWAGVVVSALMMLAPSLTGHARAAATEYRFTVFSDWLHLVASGFWVGGLFQLVLTMSTSVSGLQGAQRLRVLERAIPLFTRLAIASTVVIALTGVYNSWIHVDRLSALWSTPYGEALLVKIILFVLMVALGGVSTFIIHPKAKRLIEGDEGAATHEHLKVDRSFYRAVRLEAALGILVLLAAAVLVFLQPVREHPMNMTRAAGPDSVVVSDRR
jgi:copper transport protein